MTKASKKLSVLMGGLMAGTLLLSATAFAEAIPEYDLGSVLITATRTEKKDIDTPASTAVISKEDIEKSGARTVYDVVEHQIGVTNNAYGPGGREYGGSTSRTVFRGLDKGTLVMVNGAPINMLNYNSMEGIPVESVEKVEIVRGANSVLYGSEAFGGVVNIITKKGGPAQTTISGSIGNYDKKYSIATSGENYNIYYSKDYFGEIEAFYQLKLKYNKNGLNVRCMFDRVIVNHITKAIQPIDLKTTGKDEEEFENSFLAWSYWIQSNMYSEILKLIIEEDDYFKDFTILPFLFVVVNKNNKTYSTEKGIIDVNNDDDLTEDE